MAETSPTVANVPTPARRWVIPFLETEPLFDVRWGLLLLPVWWILGIEQFIWPVIFGWATVKMLYIQRLQLRVNGPVLWFALFMVAILISGLFIVETERWLTYFRNLGAFLAGFLGLLIIVNRARTWRQIEQLLDTVLLIVLLAGFLGLLAVLGIWQPTFPSLAGRVLPASVLGTSYGNVVAYRSLGQLGWFVGLGLYFRLNSFFLFSNHYSSVLVYAIPFLFYKLWRVKGQRRLLIALGIVLLSINLVYTTGRVAALSILGGAIVFLLFYTVRRRSISVLSALAMAVIMWLIVISTVVQYGLVGGEGGILNEATGLAEEFVFARGTGSYTSRFGVYIATVEGFLERPLFGWGTERDVIGLDLPAGSHSEYFAALYRQGLLGLIALLGLYWSVWRATRPIWSQASEPAGALLRYGRWFFIGAVVNSLLNDPNVDSTTYVLLWVLMGILVATARIVRQQNEHVQ